MSARPVCGLFIDGVQQLDGGRYRMLQPDDIATLEIEPDFAMPFEFRNLCRRGGGTLVLIWTKSWLAR